MDVRLLKHHALKPRTLEILPCDEDCLGVVVEGVDWAVAQLVGGHAEDSGTASRIDERTRAGRVCVIGQIVEELEASPGGSVGTSPEAHPGVDFKKNVVGIRRELLPAWLDDNALRRPEGMEILLPALGPVLALDDAVADGADG